MYRNHFLNAVEFKTSLSKIEIVEKMKRNTKASGIPFESFLFRSDQYFKGEVNEKKISIKNANRNNKNPSAVFDIFIQEEGTSTIVTIKNDALEQLNLIRVMVITIFGVIGVVLFLVGMVIFFSKKDYTALKFAIGVCIVTPCLGLFNVYLSKLLLQSNTLDDEYFLLLLLRK